jgi:hypothetical protein
MPLRHRRHHVGPGARLDVLHDGGQGKTAVAGVLVQRLMHQLTILTKTCPRESRLDYRDANAKLPYFMVQ